MKKLFLALAVVILSGCTMLGPEDIKCEAYYKDNGTTYKAHVFDRRGDMFLVTPIQVYGSFWAPVSFFTEGNTCDGKF